MATTESQPPSAAPEAASAPPSGMERGAYEVIRNRLAAAGAELRARLKRLNTARKEVFGAISTKLLSTERVTTANNCVPRDITPIGDRFLFGYNVHIGLRSTTSVEDVFSVYRFAEGSFVAEGLDLIDDERFRRDFAELFKYYRQTTFATFGRRGPHLYMVFRVGKDLRDIKAFKWRVEGDRLVYLDNRSDHEWRYPPQHEFEWVRTHRDMHRAGPHPHVNIADRLFVETVGGDLTIKIEDNTESGEGIYAEPVSNPDQTLDDAEIFYALLGSLVLLRIRPYQEEQYRHFVYSEKTQKAHRLDTIAGACVLLPDDHGIIFPNGYFLQTGDCKVFDHGLSGLMYRERVQSPNGEDYLYVFYHPFEGVYVLLSYNLIEQRVRTPMICHGYSLFEDGQMILFKGTGEPQKHHALQVWQTPYVGPDYHPPVQTDSFLYKIGNRDIVRGMAECYEILALLSKEDGYVNLFVDLAKQTGDLLDAYYWLGAEEAFDLRGALVPVKEAAEAAVGEFEKVLAVRRATEAETRRVARRAREILASVRARRFEGIGDFVRSLVDLRGVRGEIIALRSLRYAEAAQADALEEEVRHSADQVAAACVKFLLRAESLRPYQEAVEECRAEIDELRKLADARRLQERVAQSAAELEMLIEVVSNLKIDDATQRTAIIDGISTILARLNQTRAVLKTRMDDLMRVEGAAEFAAQLKLLNQGVLSYLDVCDTPERCDEYLTKMMMQVEEVEGRFAEFDEFVVQLAEKREEIYNAFETRKLQLVEARNRRATALMSAAERILRGIKVRAESFTTLAELHGYFAADLMIEKVRDIVKGLAALGDSVKVDDVESRLKTIREDAVRQLKDRQDLFEEGDNVIRLGRHRFSVNRQPFDLTTVLRDGEMLFHLTGTAFFERIDDPELLGLGEVWTQTLVSENRDVYRGEYLAMLMFEAARRRSGGAPRETPSADGEPEQPESVAESVPAADALRAMGDEALGDEVRRFMGPRYAEGYVKGVHDHDAARLLRALLDIDAAAGLLRYHPRARALARRFWAEFGDAERRALVAGQMRGFGRVRELFPDAATQARYIGECRRLVGEFARREADADSDVSEELIDQAGEYLFEELANGAESLVTSAKARDLYRAFKAHLDERFFKDEFAASLEAVRGDAGRAFLLARDWLLAFLPSLGDPTAADYADEAAVLLVEGKLDAARVVEAHTEAVLDGLVGDHPRIRQGRYRLGFHEFLLRLGRYRREVAPRFEAFTHRKKELSDAERRRMRLDEFRPRVLTSFVRNRLLDEVYLPLIGDNLAKQLGAAGQQKRTDRMGLLLLISPPGYGKTTLMEYVADRLGLVFMKINGPALGHQVTSLDPAEAPNAASREELHKLNLAFEMGDNVMIYVDDIQHCHPEFLQKFISLCDAQRKVEGVWRGQTRTYDLRGKKVCVVMAGNPYTESGEKFKIPDMLANRADTYNLGEVIGGNVDLFHLSYLENALTSNPVLARLAAQSRKDVHTVVRMAEGTSDGSDLEGNYAAAELAEMTTVMRKLIRVRDVVLRMNAEYIRSAGMSDEFRTEPAFKLQGSYRNMNRIAERVVAVMNDEELDTLILSSYQNDAQTLAVEAESNLLKFKELLGWLSPDEAERWEQIKRTYTRNVQLRGVGDDEKYGQLIVQLGGFSDGLHAIRHALGRGIDQWLDAARRQAQEAGRPMVASFDAETAAALKGLVEPIRAAAERAAAPSAAAQAGDGATVRTALAPETLDALRALVEQLSAAWTQAARPAAPEVHVVSRVPTTILNVVRHQFQLMQAWLEPLGRRTREQGEQLAALRQVIEQTVEQYRVLIGRLEEAARQKDALDDAPTRDKPRAEKPKREE
jgi:energy-converting hydrogenase A subunit M